MMLIIHNTCNIYEILSRRSNDHCLQSLVTKFEFEGLVRLAGSFAPKMLGIANLDTMLVSIKVSEKDLDALREGLPVKLKVKSYPFLSFWGNCIRDFGALLFQDHLALLAKLFCPGLGHLGQFFCPGAGIGGGFLCRCIKSTTQSRYAGARSRYDSSIKLAT